MEIQSRKVLKIWELLTESGRVDGNKKNLSQLRDMLRRQEANTQIILFIPNQKTPINSN